MIIFLFPLPSPSNYPLGLVWQAGIPHSRGERPMGEISTGQFSCEFGSTRRREILARSALFPWETIPHLPRSGFYPRRPPLLRETPLPAFERPRLRLSSLSRATTAGEPLVPDDAFATWAVDSVIPLLCETVMPPPSWLSSSSHTTPPPSCLSVFLSRATPWRRPPLLPLRDPKVSPFFFLLSSSPPPRVYPAGLPSSEYILYKCSKRAKEEKVNNVD